MQGKIPKYLWFSILVYTLRRSNDFAPRERYFILAKASVSFDLSWDKWVLKRLIIETFLPVIKIDYQVFSQMVMMIYSVNFFKTLLGFCKLLELKSVK